MPSKLSLVAPLLQNTGLLIEHGRTDTDLVLPLLSLLLPSRLVRQRLQFFQDAHDEDIFTGRRKRICQSGARL